MAELPRRRYLVGAGTALSTVVAGCQDSVLDSGNPPGGGTDAPGLVLSESGPGELSDSNDVHSGWVHVVAHGETYDVTFDARVCHDGRDSTDVELTDRAAGEYALAFTTGSETAEESECEFGTRITGAGSMSNDYESLRVTVNGHAVQTVPKEGTFPTLRPLPDPIDAR